LKHAAQFEIQLSPHIVSMSRTAQVHPRSKQATGNPRPPVDVLEVLLHRLVEECMIGQQPRREPIVRFPLPSFSSVLRNYANQW
jgi:hypothetical protein